jgi:uncharacterized protein (TIGR02271 family)
VLITVHAGPEQTARALTILQQNRADVGTAAAQWRGPAQGSQGPESGQRIQLLGEVLRVHKERVSKGEVRLRKEVVTERQNIEVPTTREELVIERVSGSGREAAGQQVGSGEKDIRIPLTKERVHVEKKPVVNEDVRVGKRQVQDTQHISAEVRHEELRSETKGDVDDETIERAKEKERTA